MSDESCELKFEVFEPVLPMHLGTSATRKDR